MSESELWGWSEEDPLEGSIMLGPSQEEREAEFASGEVIPTGNESLLLMMSPGSLGLGIKPVAGSAESILGKTAEGTVGSVAKRVVEPIVPAADDAVRVTLSGGTPPSAQELFELAAYQDLRAAGQALKQESLSGVNDILDLTANPAIRTKAEALKRYLLMTPEEVNKTFWGK